MTERRNREQLSATEVVEMLFRSGTMDVVDPLGRRSRVEFGQEGELYYVQQYKVRITQDGKEQLTGGERVQAQTQQDALGSVRPYLLGDIYRTIRSEIEISE